MAGPWEEFVSQEVDAESDKPWESFGGSSTPEKSSLTRRVLGDGGISLLKGAISVPEAAVGLADLVTGGRAGKAAEGIGFRPKEAKQILDEYLSPEQKAANQAVGQADGFVDKIGAIAANPSVIPHAVVESAPAMLAGGVVGRGIAAAAPKVSPLVAGAVGEGTVMAGGAAEQIRQQTDDGLLTSKQALAAAGTGLAGAAIGGLGAKVGKSLGLGDVDTALVNGTLGSSARSMPARIAGGALAEGALEEMPQSAAEQALQNYALDREIGEGVGGAAAMGLVTGAAMGAGFGAVSGRRAQQDNTGADPAVDPAVDPNEPPPLVATRGADGPDLIQPTPTAENPAPLPVERPDPNNGVLSSAASLLPSAAPVLDTARIERQLGGIDQGMSQPASPEEARIREAIADVERRARLGGMNPVLAAERARLGGELVKLQQQAAEAGQPRPALGDQRSDFYTGSNGFTRREREPWVNPASNRSSDPYDRFPGIDQVPPAPLEGELLTDAPVELGGQPAGRSGIGADARPRLTREGELLGGEVVPQEARTGIGRAEATLDGQNRAMPVQSGTRGVAGADGSSVLEGELVGGDLQPGASRQAIGGRVIEGELSPREQRALATTFKKRGAAELARKSLSAPERFTVEQQGEAFAIRQLPPPAPSIAGREIDGEWSEFAPESGTLAIPRAEMPQIKAEHRGAMVRFLNARGIQHEEQTVPASTLKPTQAEFSRQKVAQAKGFTGGDRAILVSSDGHVVDGHHQWLARREAGGEVRVIQLKAPIRDLLPVVAEFPSATQDTGAQPMAIGRQPKAPKRGQRRSVDRDRDSVVQAAIRLGGITNQWKQDTTGDTVGNKNIPGVGALWSDKTGTSLDDMASLLDQHGYVPAGEMDKDGGVSWLQDAIRDELAGNPRYAPDSARQIEQAEQELLNRYAEAVARAIDEREAEYARIEAEYGPDAAADARSFDEAAIAYNEQLDGALEDGREAQDTLIDGESVDQADAARRDDELRQADGRADRAEGENAGEAFGLEQQTEAGLAEQDRQQQARERAEAEARRKAEQKAQADAELNDFALAGSDRPADMGTARGQNDLFGAQPARAEAEVPTAQPPAEPLWERAGTSTSAAESSPPFPEGQSGSGSIARPAAENETATGTRTDTTDSTSAGDTARRSNGLTETVAQPQNAQPTPPAKPKAKRSKPAAEKPAESKIEDFGERLEGARKFNDYKQKLDAAKDLDVAAVPLSKSWPVPDYQELLDAGSDPWGVAFMRAAREEIANKPSKGYKLQRWVEQVQGLRETAMRAASEPAFAERVRTKAMTEFASLQGLIGRADLYAEFGHEVALKGISFRSHHYSVYRGEKDVTKWVVEGKPEKSALSNWPKELAVGNTREEAMAAFAAQHAAMKAKPDAEVDAGPSVRFDVYTDRTTRKSFIAKKNGKRLVRMQEFDSVREAMDYLKSNQAALEARYEAMKTPPPTRNEDNAPRIGADHRNGQDVTPELFGETFGFRGVQFGNYVENKRRIKDLNDAYDGLMDMAGILNIPPRALSLNGELGLAFGARGTGGPDPAKAHYERDSVVINLTKTNGAGSLAHEWWHALDNYLSRSRGEPDAFLTDKPYPAFAKSTRTPLEGVRPALLAAFKELNQAVGRTRMKQRAEELDKMRTKDYWSTTVEMTARAFESYVVNKLDGHGIRSDYLANIISEEGFNREEAYPYPTAAEIPAIRAAYDNIFSVIETRTDDAGNVALYSRAGLSPSSVVVGKTPANPISLAEAEAAAQAFLADYNGNIPLTYRIRKTQRELYGPQGDVDQLGIVKGAYHPERGVFTLAADHLSDTADVRETLRHEILGHYGLDTFKPEDKQALLEKILASKAEPSLKSAWDFVARVYADKSDLVQAEEVFTHLAEQERSAALKAVDFLRAALIRLLRNVGFKRAAITRSELLREVEVIAKGIRNGSRTYQGGNSESRLRQDLVGEARTAEGDGVRYSLDDSSDYRMGTPTKGIPLMSARMIASKFQTQGLKVEAVATPADLPPHIFAGIQRAGVEGRVRGLYHKATGTSYIIASNLRDTKQAVSIVLHEAIGHGGIKQLLGDRLTPVMRDIFNSIPEAERLRLMRNYQAQVQAARMSPARAEQLIAEEYVAHLAETDPQNSLLDRIVSMLRNWIRENFGDRIAVQWTRNDLVQLLAEARREVATGGRDQARKGGRQPAMAFALDDEAIAQQFEGTARAYGGEAAWRAAQDAGRTKLEYRQWVQVRTPAFKAWFGEWENGNEQGGAGVTGGAAQRGDTRRSVGTAAQADARVPGDAESLRRPDSRVRRLDGRGRVDPAGGSVAASGRAAAGQVARDWRLDPQTGEPAVFHHGTRDSFTVFDLNHPNRKDKGWLGRGVYVASDRRLADAYAKLKQGEGQPQVMGLFANVRNPFVGRLNTKQELRNASQEYIDAFTRNLRTKDHDGVVLELPDGTLELMAFEPTNVKSATENVGTFDPDSADIRFSLATDARAALDRATGPTPLDPTDPFAVENRRLREEDRTLWDKAKKVFARHFAPGGLLPQSVFAEKITRDSEFQAVEFDVRHLVGALNRAAKQEFGTDLDGLDAAQVERLAESLTGQLDPTLPEASKAAVVAMRQYIDRLSADYLTIIQERIDALQAKAGTSEQAAQAAKDAQRRFKDALDASTEPALVQALAEQKAALRERKKLKKALKGLKGEAKQAARQVYDAAVQVHERAKRATFEAMPPALRKLNTLAGEAREAAVAARAAKPQAEAEAALYEKIKANIGAYVHRSYQAFDDPQWFKSVPTVTLNAARQYLVDGYQAMGETDAESRRMAEVTMGEILKTGTAYDTMEAMISEGKLGAKDLSVLIKRKEIAPEIRALLGEYRDPRLNFAKSATKMGRLVWNQRFLDRVREVGMGSFLFTENERPADATVQIAGEQSDVYAPLNGLWTFPEVAQAFKDALGQEQMSDLYRTVVRLNGMVKYGKTVLSPTTAMRNWQSAMFFSLGNGHFDLSQMKKSISAFREQVTQSATGGDLAYLRKLKQLGVVYDTPYAGEMAALLADARMEELLSSKSGTGLKWLRKANQFAQGFYSFGDDFWKIIGFENEKAGLLAAGMDEATAEKEAAHRIRSTYPTYSMIGRSIQWLRRFPLAGTFVSFPAEIIRTSANMLRITAADLKSDNPQMRALGRKRAAGMAFVSGAFYALSALTAAAFGVDDDEEEALRDLSPDWSKNSTFLFLGRDDDGKLRSVDLSFLDPYGYWKRPITAMLRDQPWEDAAASGLGDMLAPFFGADIAAGAIFQVLANQKASGGQVYNENADSVDQLQDIANHMRKALQPGFVSNAERLWLAGSGASREGSGQPYDMRDELVTLLGWRANTLDAKTGLYYRAFDFTDGLSQAKKTLTRELRSVNAVSDGDIREVRDAAQRQYNKAFAEMARLVHAAEVSGLSRQEIVKTLRQSNIAQANIFALMQGRVPPMDVGLQAQQRAVQQARVMQGAEHAAEVARRFRVAREVQVAP